MRLSARNQIPARVTSINTGEAIANVELDANGIRLVASITVEAVRDLGLTEGSQVTAVIKASEVILATDLSPCSGRPGSPSRPGCSTTTAT
jgi:molybdopterin-binding protein